MNAMQEITEKIKLEIDRLRRALQILEGANEDDGWGSGQERTTRAIKTAQAVPKRRIVSDDAKRRISEAQTRRWAAVRTPAEALTTLIEKPVSIFESAPEVAEEPTAPTPAAEPS
jgi:hypothetical protein